MKYFITTATILFSLISGASFADDISSIEALLVKQQLTLAKEDRELSSPIRCAIQLDREDIDSIDECEVSDISQKAIFLPEARSQHGILEQVRSGASNSLDHLLDRVLIERIRQMGGSTSGNL